MNAHGPESSAREASAHRRPYGRATPPDSDAARFRHALSRFAADVMMITTCSEDRPGMPVFAGVMASSFSSVSLDLPPVLQSLGVRANSSPLFHAGPHYIINVLTAKQLTLCKCFATPENDRFVNIDYRLDPIGPPVLM